MLLLLLVQELQLKTPGPGPTRSKVCGCSQGGPVECFRTGERLRADSDRRGGCGRLRLPFRHRQTVDWSPGGWSQGPWGGTDA